jgi:hypothetical protein
MVQNDNMNPNTPPSPLAQAQPTSPEATPQTLHLVFPADISGDRFPTAFANPPGKGLSSPTLNVVWALFNLLLGYLLFRLGKVASGGDPALLTFFAGIAVISIGSSLRFVHQYK